MEYLTIKIAEITDAELLSITDHTFLKTEGNFAKEKHPVRARRDALDKFLEDTLKMTTEPYSVCVRPEDVYFTSRFLDGTDILTCSVVGFPYGPGFSTKHKLRETEIAIGDGATEIDMVMNYEALRVGTYKVVERDIFEVANLAHYGNALVKVIFETSELNTNQIIEACKICENAGADFVKTSTGFTQVGVKKTHLELMRDSFSGGVKASGGVKRDNIQEILKGLSGRTDGMIELDPMKVRIGEGSYFS